MDASSASSAATSATSSADASPLERGDQYPSVSDLLGDLQRLRTGEVPLAAPVTPRRTLRILRRRHPVLTPTTTTAALVVVLDLELRLDRLRGLPVMSRREAWRRWAVEVAGQDLLEWARGASARSRMRVVRMLLAAGALGDAGSLLEDPAFDRRIRAFLLDPARRRNEILLRELRARNRLRLAHLAATSNEEAVRLGEEMLRRQAEEAPDAAAERSRVLELLVLATRSDDPRRAAWIADGLEACRRAALADGPDSHPRLRFFRRLDRG